MARTGGKRLFHFQLNDLPAGELAWRAGAGRRASLDRGVTKKLHLNDGDRRRKEGAVAAYLRPSSTRIRSMG
jgi:hypothetical protein